MSLLPNSSHRHCSGIPIPYPMGYHLPAPSPHLHPSPLGAPKPHQPCLQLPLPTEPLVPARLPASEAAVPSACGNGERVGAQGRGTVAPFPPPPLPIPAVPALAALSVYILSPPCVYKCGRARETPARP